MSDDAIRSLAHQLEVLSAKIEAVRAEVATTNVSVARLETEVRLRACPSPGACIPLGAKLEALEKRVDPLEKIVEQLKGARLTLAAVVSVAGILGGTVGAKIIQLFTR